MKQYLNLTLTAVMLAVATMAVASPLTPQQALNAARSQTTKGMMKAPASLTSEMELVYTMSEESVPTVYVFANTEGEPGFMIVAADDVARPVLGYSEESSFDPANIPPALRYWLENASYSVGRLVAEPTFAKQSNFSVTTHRASARRAPRPAIATICTTKWAQRAPYNNDCPTIGGKVCVTGCVATAMAQVMKVYNYPTQGVGSKTYTFTSNDTTITESFDFENATFDWANMIDKYASASAGSAKQRAAVAQLMHACGVAASMKYGPSSSGAVSAKACQAMIDYFNYDKAMTHEYRKWYYLREWNDLIYGELALGRPVMYHGTDAGGAGHCFVCDGYSTDDYFHFNWGWSGTSDGYFLLTDLNPKEQGTGGGTGQSGYVLNSGALIGFQPAQEGSKLQPRIGIENDWLTTSSSITRSSSSNVTFYGGFWNRSLGLFSGSLGCKVVDQNGNVKYIVMKSVNNIAFGTGYTSMYATSSQFPVGTLKVYPVFKASDSSEWMPMGYDKEGSNEFLIFNVTSSQITVTVPDPTPDPGDQSTDPSFTYAGSTPTEAAGALYQTQDYILTFQVSAPVAWSGQVECHLAGGPNNSDLTSEPIEIKYDAAGEYSIEFPMSIPANLPVGNYKVYVTRSGETEMFNYSSNVTVTELPFISSSKLTSISPLEKESSVANPALYLENSYVLGYDLTVNKPFSRTMTCRILKKSGTRYTNVLTSNEQAVAFTAAGTGRYEFAVELPDNIDAGNYYLALAYPGDDGYSAFFGDMVPVKIDKKPISGIGVITTSETADNAEYFNLQGVRIDNPGPGIFIKVSDGKASKVMIK